TKGAGMIAPDMATMLAYIATDAVVAQTDLQNILRAVVRKTFNCVTIDGDTSTNDTVILAATGATGVAPESAEAMERFEAGLYRVCKELALSIVRDGEGVNKVVEVKISGAASEEQAHLAAKSVSESLLVKTAIHGEMPNWGRMFAAAGYSGADVAPEKMSLRFGNVEVMRDGAPVPGWADSLAPLLKQPEYGLELGLGVGDAEAVFWTTDLSAEYVRFNADYKT
ncbi:MAG: bifunctional ornithine acetyltransferase/N-acetylglutamate synthase, partial [Nitrospinae bacterium]|nr:bifunctional ornithine acetyltransferase/N-acetylglutamate synthase [Nitrospinota bacterium]